MLTPAPSDLWEHVASVGSGRIVCHRRQIGVLTKRPMTFTQAGHVTLRLDHVIWMA